MDLISYNNPIIIHSEDEDDDDDVVLVKEEKIIQDSGTNDDVIFVSEESSSSSLRNKSENQKNNSKTDYRPSSSSAVDTNDGLTISPVNVQILNSTLLSLSSIDSILQPLDSADSVILGTGALSASTNTNFTLIEQASTSSVPPQEVKTSIDAGLCSVNSHDKLHFSSEKSSLSDAIQVNSLFATTPKTSSDSATFTNGINVDSLCLDRIVAFSSDGLASPSDDSVELVKTITSMSSHSQQSTSLDVTYPSDKDSIPGTSHHDPTHDDFHGSVSAPDGLKFSLSEKTTSPSTSDSPLPLDMDIFNAEDLINLINFFDNHETDNNQNICEKKVNTPDSSDMKGSKLSKLVGSTHVSHRILPTGKATTITEYSLSSKRTFQDHCIAVKYDKQMTCNAETLSPNSTRLDYLKKSAHRKHNLNHIMRCCDSFLHKCSHKITCSHKINPKSVSHNLDSKAPVTGATHWKIVSSETPRKKRGAYFDIMNDEHPKRKQQILEASAEGKPNLKIKLKMIPPESSSVSHLKMATTYNPCNIGLKKSIMRRQASLIGEAGESFIKGIQPIVHRSVSESNVEGAQKEKDIQILCTACCKTVCSKKMARCCKGHNICTTCLEPQVKVILTGDVKQKNVKCPSEMCTEALSFDELRKTLPSFVVDILEKKLDNEYLSYITKWMFTDEQLKTRSEFATLDTKITPSPAFNIRKYEEIYSQESGDVAADLPASWAPMERGAPVMAFEVVPDTEEYRALACQFYETCPFGDYDIARIIRVQNPILWKYFALKQSEMVQENDGMDVAVTQLYHGTYHSTLEAISRKGFDWRLSGKHGTVYGNGSYFARTAHYSHAFTDCAGSGVSVRGGGRSSYMFPTSTLSHYSFNPPRQSLWSMFPTLQSLNPACSSSSQSQPQQQTALSRHSYTAFRQVPHSQVQPNQPTVKDSACATSRSSSLSSSLDVFLGASTSSAASAVLNYISQSAPSMFSTASPPQTQTSNFSSCFTNTSLSSSDLGLLQTTSLPALSLWDSLEDSLRDKKGDIQMKSDQVDLMSSCSGAAADRQCREKGTANLSSAFARSPNSKTHFMFVAKVLVGRHTGGKSGLKRPPPLDESNPYGKCYDSCVDNIFSPQVYVIFDSNQAYPEYVIEYNWHKS